ncbi:hypothetical protein B0H13DRAFT_1865958 [Mycena leptocephala]|nr:hypothetical protein B0H13DRAFT_1865958 [Mycena leptocephala]
MAGKQVEQGKTRGRWSAPAFHRLSSKPEPTGHSEPTSRFPLSKAEIPEVKHSQRETLSSSLKHALCPQAGDSCNRFQQISDPDLDPDAPSRITTRFTLRPRASSKILVPTLACGLPVSRMSPTTNTPMATNGNRGSRSVKLVSVEYAMQALHAASDSPTPTPYATTAL